MGFVIAAYVLIVRSAILPEPTVVTISDSGASVLAVDRRMPARW